MLARHLEQLCRAMTLLPQRHPAAMTAGQQQGTGGAFPEPGREQGGTGHLPGDEPFHLIRCDLQQLWHQQVRQLSIGEPQDETVIVRHRPGIHPRAPLHEGCDRHAPGSPHRTAEGAVHHHPPVTQLVAEPLHHHRPLVRHHPGSFPLLCHEGDQLVPGRPVQPGKIDTVLADAPQQLPDPAAQLSWPGLVVAAPERELPKPSWCGGHQHLVAGDPNHRPRRRTQREGLTHARLVHHLLIQLPDPPARPAALGQEHPVETPVRDRASRRDRQPLYAGQPHQAATLLLKTGPQLGEVGAGIGAEQ